MTEYNDFSDLDMTDADAMTERMHETDERLDSIPISTAVLMTLDAFDVDPIEFLTELRDGRRRWSDGTGERLALDLIESSQSNFERSIHALLEVATLDQKIADLGMEPTDD